MVIYHLTPLKEAHKLDVFFPQSS